MHNWLSNHAKILMHSIFLYLILLLLSGLISTAAFATNNAINVYLKLIPNNKVVPLITDFNQFLQHKKIFQLYDINPFINKHPLHITLYLTTYNKKQIPLITKKIQALAMKFKPISVSTNQFTVNNTGYVMLSLTNTVLLQQLSNQTTFLLANFRDKKALIPSWASNDRQRIQMFQRYGSPNVFTYFTPHFSLFDAAKQNSNLSKKLGDLIIQFSKKNQIHIDTTAYAIGIGIANPKGQIIKELAEFKLGIK